MKIISHRGNLQGLSAAENSPEQVQTALDSGFYVEVDLWLLDGVYSFGHDRPEWPVKLADWDHERIFFHLKNPHLPRLSRADCFFIQKDPHSLTLRGRIWTDHGRQATRESVVCAPELVGAKTDLRAFMREYRQAWGICTDYAIAAAQFMEEELGR